MDYGRSECGTTGNVHHGPRGFFAQVTKSTANAVGNASDPRRRSAARHDLGTLPGALLQRFEQLTDDPLIDAQYDKAILSLRMQ